MVVKRWRAWLTCIVWLAVICMLVWTVAGNTHQVSAANDEFVIENGVLVEYRGTGSDVVIPNSVRSIGANAFNRGYGREIKSVFIPNSVTSIGISAFSGCHDLTSVTIPDSVTSLGNYAFAYCNKLESVSIGSGVAEIGVFVFGNSGVKTITVSSRNSKYDSRNNCNAMILTKSNSLVLGCAGTVIPSSVTNIEDRAFQDCIGLKSITIPSSVTRIGDHSFDGCALSSITIPGSVKRVEDYAFINCTQIENITIENGVNYIGAGNFWGCKIKSIHFPESVQTIASDAFSDCEELVSIYIPGNIVTVGNNAFWYPDNWIQLKRVFYYNGTYSNWCGLMEESRPFIDMNDVVCHSDTAKFIKMSENWKMHQLKCWYVGKNVTTASASWKSDNADVAVSNTGKLTNKSNGAACLAHITTSVGPLSQTITVTSDKKPDVFVRDIVLNPTKETIDVPVYTIGIYVYNVYPTNATNKGIVVSADDASIAKVTYDPTVNWIMIEGLKLGSTVITIRSKDGYVKKEIPVRVKENPNGVKLGERTYCFDTAWFSGVRSQDPEKDFNQQLAQFCSYFCMYGYRESDELSEDGHKKGDRLALEKQLAIFGFSLMETNIDTIRFNGDSDKVKYYIAKRDDRDVGGKVYIFAGFIGSYGKQWNSNFDPIGMIRFKETIENMPEPIVHSGFNDARNFVEERLRLQIGKIDNYKKDDAVYIFTGHSRGAATANLVAADFIRGEKTNDIRKPDEYHNEMYGFISPENVYAYTFATPNNILKKAPENEYNKNDTLYNRIYNIVNPEDFVTYMLPEAWGYTKYGTTYEFPTKTQPRGYSAFVDKVKDYYYENRVYVSGIPEYIYREAGGKIITQEEYERLENLYGAYAGVFKDLNKGELTYVSYGGEETVSEFVDNMTNGCKSIYELYTQKDYYYKSRWILYAQGGLIENINLSMYQYFQTVLCPFAYGSNEWSKGNLVKGLHLPGNPSGFFIENEALKGFFSDAHEMETYAAFIYACPRGSLKAAKTSDTKAIKMAAYCPVDIEVIENDTEDVVARIVNNVIDETIAAKGNALHAYVEGDSKVVYIPDERLYTIRVVGNGEGTLDIVKTIYDNEGHEAEREYSYDIPVSDQYEMEYAQAYGEDGEEIENRYIVNEYGENAAELVGVEKTVFSVDAQVEGAGSVYGIGEFANADYICVTAEPEEGFRLLGWFEGDTLVSEQENYYFLVKHDTMLEAKFVCSHDVLVNHPATEPTCKNEGNKEYWTCEACGLPFDDEETSIPLEDGEWIVEQLQHELEMVDGTEPTCDEEGLSEGVKCKLCGEFLWPQEIIPPKGHDEPFFAEENRKEPTCEEEGTVDNVVYCGICKKEIWRETVSIEMLEHEVEYVGELLPTCESDGHQEGIRCKHCLKYLDGGDIIPAVEHEYHAVVTTQPTYVLTGTRTFTCEKCGDVYTETIPRLDLPFTDVKKTGWQASTVRFMLDNLLMSGVSATKFAPDSIMNRGQLVAILWNMEGKPKVSGTLSFTDVPTTNTFYKAILWASQNKVVNGYSTGDFKPKGELTREQITTILMNYAKYKGIAIAKKADLTSFQDVAQINRNMVTSMQWAVGNKIISGKNSGTLLDPKGMATRIEVAAMVMNYCKNIK